MSSATALTPTRTVSLAGRAVPRLGFGALHLAGPGGWGAPTDRGAAIRLVRGAIEAGVRYVDTADSLGPDVSEAVIAEALRPYADDVVVATKAGMTRTGPHGWGVLGHPDYLRQQAHASALRLGLDPIPLFYLHRVDPGYPLADQAGALAELREEGVIAHVGLSAVTSDQLAEAERIVPISAVQNHYNVVTRESEGVLAEASRRGIPFVSFWSLGRGRELLEHVDVVEVAADLGVPAASLLLAWIVGRSPTTLPLAGTRNPAHLRANLAAVSLELPAAAVARLDDLSRRLGAVPAFPTR